jgi:hypothetical protein
VAIDQRALELITLGDKLFGDKKQLDSLCQEVAWHFAPDLADFTTKLILGQDFAIDRMDSFPELMSRELTNQLSAMLRPTDRPWFRLTTLNDEVDANEDNARYLEYVSHVIRRYIYDPRSKFVRATKLADRFYVNFGMAVISVEEAPRTRDHLFFRSHHLKDCAWLENETGEVDHLHRKEMITARKMVERFGKSGALAPEVKEAAEKTPNKEFEIRVVVMPADEYDTVKEGPKGPRKKLPYVVLYLDQAHQRVIREGGLPTFNYVVPRWSMFASTQYAFSPCAMLALPDARMAQMVNQILLEAGEKSIDPPLIAKQEIVIGEPNIQAGGISWVDLEHDASLKEAIDAIRLEPDMKTGFEIRKDLREMLSKAFFIDKLGLPEPSPRMTAYELGRRLEEHIRNLLPLFEPMQQEYNTRLLDKTYATLANMNVFAKDAAAGIAAPLPPGLSGADVTWAFESPIQQASDQVKVEYFKGALELVGLGMQGGATANPLHVDRSLRDAIRGLGTPATWRKTDGELQHDQQQMAQEKAAAAQMQAAHAVSQIAQNAGDAGSKMGDAGQKFGLLPPAAQKVVQGSAQGSPELAGAMGMSAPDVGDQGPAANPNESMPQPWMPNQTQAVLSGDAGTGFSAGAGLDASPGPALIPQAQPAQKPVSVPMQQPRSRTASSASSSPSPRPANQQPRDAAASAGPIVQVARDLVRELSSAREDSMRTVSDIAAKFGESNAEILAKFHEATVESGKSNTASMKTVKDLVESLSNRDFEKDLLQAIKKIAETGENKDAGKELLGAMQKVADATVGANADTLQAVEKATSEMSVAVIELAKSRELAAKPDPAPQTPGQIHAMPPGGAMAPQQLPASGGTDLASLLARLVSQVSTLEENVNKPKKISIQRNEKGQIVGATATPQI